MFWDCWKAFRQDSSSNGQSRSAVWPGRRTRRETRTASTNQQIILHHAGNLYCRTGALLPLHDNQSCAKACLLRTAVKIHRSSEAGIIAVESAARLLCMLSMSLSDRLNRLSQPNQSNGGTNAGLPCYDPTAAIRPGRGCVPRNISCHGNIPCYRLL